MIEIAAAFVKTVFCLRIYARTHTHTRMRAAPTRPSLALAANKARPVCFIAALSLGNQSSSPTRSVKRRILLLVSLPLGELPRNFTATSPLLLRFPLSIATVSVCYSGWKVIVAALPSACC
jgi:hypothetical protein